MKNKKKFVSVRLTSKQAKELKLKSISAGFSSVSSYLRNLLFINIWAPENENAKERFK
jgi:hypothetical protein